MIYTACFLCLAALTRAQGSGSPPKISIPQGNNWPRSLEYIRKGNNKTFECVAVGPGPLKYEWRFDGQRISARPAEVRFDANTGSLFIGEYFNEQLTGDYQCVVSNAYGTAMTPYLTISATVAYAFPGGENTFAKNVEAYATNYFTMDCENIPRSVPQWTFDWQRGKMIDNTLSDTSRVPVGERMVIDPKGNLHFLWVEASDNGYLYVCETKNEIILIVRRNTQAFNLNVMTGSGRDRSPALKYNDDVTVRAGQTAKLTCIFTYYSARGENLQIDWIFRNKKVGEGTTLEMENVKFPDALQNQERQYMCEARLGMMQPVRGTVTLKIIAPPEFLPGKAPQVTSVSADKDAEFYCSALSHNSHMSPPVWMVNGVPLIGCPPYYFDCVATKADGFSECIPKKQVYDNNPDCTNEADENICPQITCAEGFKVCNDKCVNKDAECLSDSSVRSFLGWSCDRGKKCLVEGKRCDGTKDCTDGSDEKGCPNLDTIQRGRFQINSQRTELVLPQVTLDDAMCFQCVVENEHGYLFGDGCLTVIHTTIEEDSESGNVTNAHGKLTTYTAAPEAGPTTCSASIENGAEWPEAQDGKISLSKCQKGYEGHYYRRCQKGTFLNPVNNCTRKAIRDLHARVLNGSINSTEALSTLKNQTNTLTTATENLPTAGDLQNVNQILDEIIDIIEINSSTIKNDSNSFFDVANNLLDGKSTSSWKSLIDDKGVGAVSVLTTIDRFISKVVNSSDGNFTMEVDKPNLFIEIGQVDSCDNITFPSNAVNTKNTTNSMEDQIVVGCGQGKNVFSGGLFKNMSGMLPTTSNDIDSLDSSINGPVLSFSFHRQQNRTENVSITFHVFDNELRDPACSFWKTNLSGNSRWSTEGCELEHFDSETGTVSCKCNHLTNFAVLMSPASTTETETVHHRSLGVLSIVGCSISILGLVLTIAIYVYFWRTVHSTRSVLLLNLCTVLVVAYVLFLAGVDYTSQPAVCTSIAVLLHYIFLAAFFLMLSEGCIIAQKVLRPLDKRNILQALLGISYGLPLVVVIISAASSKLKGYGNDKFCWLSIDSGLFWAFAGPALTIIFTNTIITVAVIKRLFGTSAMSKRGDADKIKTGLRSVCVLLPVFGITWLFGVFAVNKDTVVFQYLFVIFNSLQGVLIFVVQCILDRKVQEAFKARRARWLAPEVSITATEMKTKSSAVTKSNATESTA